MNSSIALSLRITPCMMCPDKSRTEDTICVFPDCQRTVWKDPDGSYSAFCGKGHRDAMPNQPVAADNQVCKNCHARPVYNENGHLHDFCGVRCARAFMKQGGQGVPPPNPITPQSRKACSFLGCNRLVWVGEDNTESEYCSRRHRTLAVNRGAEPCLNCQAMPKVLVIDRRSDFCSATCKQEAVDSAPAIFQLGKDEEQSLSISQQFTDSWKHPGDPPVVVKIWKIYNNKAISDVFEQYKLSIERKSGFANGNVRRRWHGTVRACTLGDNGDNVAFCDDNACSLCRILQSSFQLARFGQRTNFGRFGRGIYTSATSSKANAYLTQCINSPSPYRAMLLNDVVMGKTIKLTTSNESLTEPPEGYDSVVGEPGNDLNYDESIVYKNDAIRPAYMVIFKQAVPEISPATTQRTVVASPMRSPRNI